nr:hypothetical protein [uncultured Campylobacter sp.]
MHAIRPIFYAIDKSPFVKSVDIKFEFFSGFALSQKIKSIDSLLNSAKRELKSEKILEISKASPSPLGRALSAFNLKLRLKDEDQNLIEASVERFFQGSKFFERGGPFEEIIFSAKVHPKKYPPLKNSGNFCGFELFGERFSTEPKTYFYDFLYLSALKENPNLADEVLKYDYFSDIEFNPKKSFSAQSRAAALFVGLSRNGIFKEIFADKDAFFDFYCKNFKRESLF